MSQISRYHYEHRIFGESRRELNRHASSRTGDHLPAGCQLLLPFCVVAGACGVGALSAAPARSGDTTDLNRRILTVAGSVDAITADVLLDLAQRRHRTLLIVEQAIAGIVAGAIILPAIGVPPPIAYPYWRDMRPSLVRNDSRVLPGPGLAFW